jgi:hypothetical protein
MKADLGDYLIKSEKGDLSLALYRKEKIQESKFTNAENVGKEKLVEIGFYSDLKSLFKAVSKYVVIDNEDLSTIIDKLNNIEGKAREITRLLTIERSRG